ncbi:MAG TPA: hypothetical protein VGC58_02315 [Candidatus Paceibacterota bacterium]
MDRHVCKCGYCKKFANKSETFWTYGGAKHRTGFGCRVPWVEEPKIVLRVMAVATTRAVRETIPARPAMAGLNLLIALKALGATEVVA